jgi:hypothetical protein
VPATNVIARGTVPSGMLVTNCTSSAGSCAISPDNLRVEVAQVNPNAQVNIAFSALIPGTATNGQVYEVVWTVQSDEGDLNLGDNKSGVGVLIQSGCHALLPRTTYSVAAAGDRLRVDVAAAPGCSWSAASSVNWITPAGPMPISGSGVLRVDVAPNTGPAPRTQSIGVAGETVTVVQAAAGCVFTPSVPSNAIPQAGGSYDLSVAAAAGCPWTASAAPAWITFNTVPIGVGAGSVPFTSAANPQ